MIDAAAPELVPGSGVHCRPEVLARLRAIAVPFVRRVTASRVAAAARAHGVGVVDLAFFERMSSY